MMPLPLFDRGRLRCELLRPVTPVGSGFSQELPSIQGNSELSLAEEHLSAIGRKIVGLEEHGDRALVGQAIAPRASAFEHFTVQVDEVVFTIEIRSTLAHART